MPPTHDPQLLKGVLSLLLLRLLADRESYGYEVVQSLHQLGLSDISDGTVYPALARLERESRVSARLVSSRSGPARKYYRPTEAGYAALTDGVSLLALACRRGHSGVVTPLPAPTSSTYNGSVK